MRIEDRSRSPTISNSLYSSSIGLLKHTVSIRIFETAHDERHPNNKVREKVRDFDLRSQFIEQGACTIHLRVREMEEGRPWSGGWGQSCIW
jgi:hypothetical protein